MRGRSQSARLTSCQLFGRCHKWHYRGHEQPDDHDHGDSWLCHILVSYDVDRTGNVVTITKPSFDSFLFADHASMLDSAGLRVHELEGASEPTPAHWLLNVAFAGAKYECAIVHRVSQLTIVILGLQA